MSLPRTRAGVKALTVCPYYVFKVCRPVQTCFPQLFPVATPEDVADKTVCIASGWAPSAGAFPAAAGQILHPATPFPTHWYDAVADLLGVNSGAKAAKK